MADIAEYLTVPQVARLLRRHERIIHRYISKGYLPARRVGKIYLIHRRDVETFVYPKPGNPLLRKLK